MQYIINQDNYHSFETLAVNRLAPRSYFIPYPDREQAERVSLRQKRYASPKVFCKAIPDARHFGHGEGGVGSDSRARLLAVPGV